MKDKLFKIISTLISLLLVFSSVAVFAQSDKVYKNKLTTALQEKLETAKSDEKIDIYLWTVDIDYDKVESETLKKTGVSQQKIDELSVKMQDSYFEKNGIKNKTEYMSGEKSVDLEKWVKDTGEVREVLDEKVDLYISSKREIAKKQYDEVNTKTLKALGVSEKEVVFKSEYSPMFIASLTKAKIEKLAKSGLVAFMDEYVELEIAEEEPVDEESEIRERFVQKMLASVSPMAAAVPFAGTMNQHKAAIDLDQLSSAFNGYGVKIGQFESGTPDKSDPYLTGHSVTISGAANTGSHATRVARILVGNEGVAPNAALVSIQADSKTTIVSRIETLLSNSVNIINMSAGLERNFNVNNNEDKHFTGYYSTLEKWIDHISIQHNVTFVKSAGNDGENSNHTITVPGLAYNVITVGNFHEGSTTSKDDDYIYSKSSYANGETNGCAKPDLIAPGCDFYGTGDSYGGTSYAAPMVTGTIALMMQMNSMLKTNPVLVKAIVSASCDRKVRNAQGGSYTEAMDGLTAKQGAGVINASNCMLILGNGRFLRGSTYEGFNQKDIVNTSSNSRKTFALAWERRNLLPDGSHDTLSGIFAMPDVDFTLHVYGPNYDPYIGASGLTNSSVEFVNRATSLINFRIIFNGNQSTNEPTRYALAWN